MGSTGWNCHLFTTKINEESSKTATERISQMEDLISVHEISYDGHDTDIVATVSDAMSNTREIAMATPIDFLFIQT